VSLTMAASSWLFDQLVRRMILPKISFLGSWKVPLRVFFIYIYIYIYILLLVPWSCFCCYVECVWYCNSCCGHDLKKIVL
jgi:hypothetical protein